MPLEAVSKSQRLERATETVCVDSDRAAAGKATHLQELQKYSD